jgi:hypothetical protein
VALSNIRNNFTRDLKQEPLQIYDILAYKSMQPHPLRDDIFRMQTEGEFMNLAVDVRGNAVKINKLCKITSLIEKTTGQMVPKMPPPIHVSPGNKKKSPKRKAMH